MKYNQQYTNLPAKDYDTWYKLSVLQREAIKGLHFLCIRIAFVLVVPKDTN